MYKYVIVFLVFFLFFGGLVAQKSSKSRTNIPAPKLNSPIKDRIFVGGSLGLQFGSVTIIDISPLIGYLFTEKLAGGVGLTYQYFKDNRYIPEYSTDIYGVRLFGRYYIFDNIFGHAEYEWLNYKAYNFINEYSRINLNNVLLGGGYRQWISTNSSMAIEVLWNVNESVYSLYSNPIIRIGINVGI